MHWSSIFSDHNTLDKDLTRKGERKKERKKADVGESWSVFLASFKLRDEA
jgi:uncharacterized protein YdcH (DUF465 family)